MNYILQRKNELLRRLGDIVNRTNYAVTDEIERDYFAAPSDSIGGVVFQHSDSKVNEKSGNILIRVIFSFLVGIAGVVLAGAVIVLLSPPVFAAYILAVILFGIGLYFGWISTQYSRFICYVGTNGAQWIEANKNKQNIVTNDTFLFENATDLTQSLTKNYTNGVYQGTEFTFKWFYRNEGNKFMVFNCSGKYKEDSDEIMPGSYAGARYLFAMIVEQQWTEYLLEKYMAEIESGRAAEFSQGRKSVFRVGSDFIEFQTGNKTERIEKSNLDLIMSEKNDNAQTKVKIMSKKTSNQFRATEFVIYPDELSNFSAFIKIVEKYIGNVY